jgi:hypothetical protein
MLVPAGKEKAMHRVHPKKKASNVLTVKVDPLARRGRAVYGKAGVHKDKRCQARVNERVTVKREW